METKIELDDFQKSAIEYVNKEENVLITAHTGSGKTIIAKYAIKYWTHRGKRVIYTSPIKTLSNEKYKEFREEFKEIKIGILTGDNKINPDGNCLIMTTEILRNSLYGVNDLSIGNILENVKCVIFDEIHYINDIDRGHVWEETIMMLNKDIQLVMLSATIQNANEFAKWIEQIKEKKTNLITTERRVVPLTFYIMTNKLREIYKDKFNNQNYIESYEAYKNDIKKNNLYKIRNLLNVMKVNNLFQTIIFTFSRNNAEHYATSINLCLLTKEEIRESELIFNKNMIKYDKQYEKIEQYNKIKKMILTGICYHHSGLLPILKEIIEILFKDNLIKVLFATETFAVGVNMPTRSVVFTELEKFDGTKKRYLTTSEFKQMSGRAGRRGIDVKGNVIILPCYELIDLSVLNVMICGKVNSITSKIKFNYDLILKILEKMNQSPVEFLNTSLFTTDQQNTLNEIKKRIKTNEKILKDNKIEKDIIEKCKELEFFEIKERLNKKEKKLMNDLHNDLDLNYEKYKMNLELEKNINKDNQTINEIEIYNKKECDKIIKFLKNFGYIYNNIDKLDKTCVSIKGTIACYLNECNGIIMTEMLYTGLLDKLTAEEITGILAIFIEEAKNNESELSITNASSNLNINKCLNSIDKFINEFLEKEEEIGLCSEWKVMLEYVEIAYKWVSGISFNDIEKEFNIYIGNFVRGMLKIHNITNELENVCNITKNYELIKKLQKIRELIIRDIVNTNSIYINS